MTLDEFKNKYLGQKIDFDGQLGPQCMDLVEQYNKEVINGSPLGGNACDLVNNPRPNLYRYQANSPIYIPPAGAIAVWNKNLGAGFGHCAIVLSAGLMSFTSLDQNWGVSLPVTVVKHDYTNVAGFLLPRSQDVITQYNSLVDALRNLLNNYSRV